MYDFSQDDLKKIAGQSEKNIQIFWDIFALDGVPQPAINAGVVWAVLTAAVNEGWVEIPGDEPRDVDAAGESAQKAQEREDLYMLGFMRGEEKARAEAEPRRDDAEDRRLVTMSESGADVEKLANVVIDELAYALESTSNGDGQLAAVGAVSVGEALASFDAEAAVAQEKKVAEVIVEAPRRLTGQERSAALQSVIGDLREMALGNVMPSEEKWDKERPKGQMSSEMIKLRFDIDWRTLADYAKLELARRGRPPKSFA